MKKPMRQAMGLAVCVPVLIAGAVGCGTDDRQGAVPATEKTALDADVHFKRDAAFFAALRM